MESSFDEKARVLLEILTYHGEQANGRNNFPQLTDWLHLTCKKWGVQPVTVGDSLLPIPTLKALSQYILQSRRERK